MKPFRIGTRIFKYESAILQIDFEYLIEVLKVRVYADSGARFYVWEFGDGGYSYTKDPVHLYKQPGLYDVTLTVHDCVSFRSITKQIDVSGAMLEMFGWTDLVGGLWESGIGMRW